MPPRKNKSKITKPRKVKRLPACSGTGKTNYKVYGAPLDHFLRAEYYRLSKQFPHHTTAQLKKEARSQFKRLDATSLEEYYPKVLRKRCKNKNTKKQKQLDQLAYLNTIKNFTVLNNGRRIPIRGRNTLLKNIKDKDNYRLVVRKNYTKKIDKLIDDLTTF